MYKRQREKRCTSNVVDGGHGTPIGLPEFGSRAVTATFSDAEKGPSRRGRKEKPRAKACCQRCTTECLAKRHL